MKPIPHSTGFYLHQKYVHMFEPRIIKLVLFMKEFESAFMSPRYQSAVITSNLIFVFH